MTSGKSFRCSKRAQDIVAMCRNDNNSSGSSRIQTSESPLPGSPALSSYSWWDGVYEAADLHFHETKKLALAKRRLFLSDEPTPVVHVSVCQNETSILAKLGVEASPIVESVKKSKKFSSPIFRGNSTCSSSQADNSYESPTRQSFPVSESTPSLLLDEFVSPPADPACSTSEEAPIPSLTGNSSNSTLEIFMDNSNGVSKSSCNTQQMKRAVFPSQRKICNAKEALNSGEQHMTPAGVLRQGRYVKQSCQDKCNRCSTPRLTSEERLLIHKSFWALRDHKKQWEFIANLITCSAPKRKISVDGSKGGKHTSRIYHFYIDGLPRKVCKTMFKNTLCICDSWLDSALSHSSGSEMENDLRGKHMNRPRRKIDTIQ